ncbi:ABC transporter substrate-binding protein [Leucobacter sp. wl10]|uniref:ABC transporter substrate-binding protein n=1 Tax=Leucobacter sp. wl10 TaxID=2304677 RepID=UPI000E5B5A21|nr:ABC transporter substrate-binding protein [Leucobacter sp. wl10]RGE21014.1 amino acid ABC transporter substrate-binding protein [Leucobacter sp. wl10]
MKKQILAGLALAASAGLLLTGCSAGSNSSSGADAATKSYGDCDVSGKKGEFTLKTLTEGQLTVKADLPSKGWYNGDTVNSIKDGVDFCILANIAYRSGIDKIDLQNASFDGLIAGKAGDMDLTLNQITITDERAKIFDFSEPYYSSTVGVVVKKGSDIDADSLRDAKIGVKQGTTEQLFVEQTLKPSQQVSVFPGDPELDAAVAAGQIDAAVQDLSVALGSTSASNGAIEVIGQYDSGQNMGVLLPKDSPNTAVVSEIIAQMKQDGTIDELASKYLSKAYGVDPTEIPVWSL